MAEKETLIRHNLIINKLRRSPLTWKELDAYLKQESEIQGLKLDFVQRTFQRHINDILEIYAVSIKSDRSTRRYYIEADEGHVDRSMQAFDILNLLRMGDNSSNVVLFERRRPMGTEHLAGIFHAIRNNLLLKFEYQKYYEAEAEQRKLLPLAIKEAKNRWYVVGQDLDRNAMRVFAVDRMCKLDFGKKQPASRFAKNVELYFKNSFGVLLATEDQEVEEIVLSYSSFQGNYIKSMPLHESQELLVDNEEEVRVRLRLYVTRDLIMEILSVGAQVKVLAPQSLADTVKAEHKKAIEL
ncbi:WYL domain-containing protein [Sphingobacterium faecale]|uniref:WYL domain-containing protein n=1 Tax=Sphingobacterium faecale TaxID=2803775 RepID=A0ABS1R239_9SPHI|nr:WYL domain-containing protein [Sphingobacterium faecale]MBL1408708.1 WYL domain-containing protein [Sphingobacterium faecale]